MSALTVLWLKVVAPQCDFLACLDGLCPTWGIVISVA
jgi:hypothetical protein